MKKLKDSIRKHEGLCLKPYRCPEGKLTIGYGRNLSDKGISEREADIMLHNDLMDALAGFNMLPHAFLHLDGTRRRVIIEMIFMLGMRGFLAFKKMMRAIEAGDFASASFEILNSKMATQVGKRASFLAETMRTGIWPK